MTRDQLELVLAREGLTRPQTTTVLAAAEAYATSQAELAIGVYAMATAPRIMHWQAHKPMSGPACRVAGVCTTVRADVRCEACKKTPEWKKAA